MSAVSFSIIFALSVPVLFLFAVRAFNGYLKNKVVDIEEGDKRVIEGFTLQKPSIVQRIGRSVKEFQKDFRLYENNILTIIGGVGAYLLAAQINPALVNSGLLTRAQIIRLAGPFIEEVLKAIVLIYLVRRDDYPISVGVLYGFGAGIGFAMVENIEYILPRANIAFTVAYSRVFSTNLVHATCSGLIGAAMAYLKFYRAPRDYFVASLFFIFGVGLHMGFNAMVNEGIFLAVALAVGLLGGLFIVALSRYANKRHGSYAAEMITIAGARASHNEASLVRTEEDLRKVFKEVEAKFSTYHAQLVDDFLKTQVEIITKRKILEVTRNEGEVKKLQRDIDALIDQTNRVRNKLGWDCMIFVRTRYSVDEKLWTNIKDRITAASTGQKGGGIWDAMSVRIKESKSEEHHKS